MAQESTTTQTQLGSEQRRGIIAGFGCYLVWGLLPLYWKLLGEVNSLEIVAHRVIWCFATTIIVCLIMRNDLRALFRDPRAWRLLAPAAVIVTFNWGIYIYAVEIEHVLETSLGYYINPLMTVLFGVIFFREKLTTPKLIAVVLCTIGVVFFTINYGSFPFIAIALALTFAIYGVLKKKGGYPAVSSLAFENSVMVLPAIIFAIVLANVTGTHAFGAALDTPHGWLITLLLVGAGPATALPLILFASASNKIPLTLLGFMQYISPTTGLLLGVFVFGEPFTFAHAVCLGLIWTGIAIVAAETIHSARKA